MEKYSSYTTEEFVLDDDFMHWALRDDERKDYFWEEFALRHPEKKEEMDKAVYIIRSLRVDEPPVPSREFKHLRRKSNIGRQLLKIAALFLLILSLGGLFYYYQYHQRNFFVEIPIDGYNKSGKIILPNGTVTEFESKETHIRQTASGNLTVNNDTLRVELQEIKTDKNAMTQIIIPYGKRSEITLADGTRVWLNAGSTLSYPLQFTQNKREVYLSGEAFFEVVSNKSEPFYVITNDMRIRVTGTRFNVSCYNNDALTAAVLVEGRIEASGNRLFARSFALSPGERIVYDRTDKIMQKDRVDTSLYSSWIDGYLIIDNEPVELIFKKLERYYNKEIVTDNLLDRPRFSGKLNLADDLEKVLKNIAFSGSFGVVAKDERYIITQKMPMK